jgi:hypothetical protein
VTDWADERYKTGHIDELFWYDEFDDPFASPLTRMFVQYIHGLRKTYTPPVKEFKMPDGRIIEIHKRLSR